MIGRVLGNRYEIIEKIGGGGMSIVYKAKCRVLNRFVAIKILRDELTSDPDFVAKFKQESLSAASLTHPNIVNIYDTGIEGDIYYIVMEYVKGETLKKYISRKGKLSEQEAIKISKQIAEALKHAHSNNIVHRDIKPHNILITEDGIAKVTDFGIARAATSSTINNTSNVIGSVHYFSPEQARGGYVDEKSDIYSLGIVMYEMVTGVVPFDADNHISVAMKQIQEKPVPPSAKIRNLQISKGLEDIIMKCLEKHQSFRFQSIDELIKKIDSLYGFNTDTEHEDDAVGEDAPGENAEDEGSYEEEQSPEERKKNRGITIAALLSALAVAVIGGMIALKAILYVPEVSVPDLLGRNEEEAQKIIEDMGLIFKVSGREYSKEYDEGRVMEQSVDEGKKIKEKSNVDVVVSKGKKSITVPDLVGKYSIEAGIILKDASLKEGSVKEANSDKVPAGQIMDQSPDAGTPANENDAVDYIVSLGPKIVYVKMPKVTGLEVNAAKLLIAQSGLTAGGVSEEPSEDVAKGLVVRQSVAAGQDVAQGTSILLTISSGKPEAPSEENPEEKPGEKPEEKPEEKPTASSYPLTITLPSNKDKVLVVVQKVADGGREIVYSKEVDTSAQSIIVNIKGSGTEVFEIYIDNELYDRAEIKF